MDELGSLAIWIVISAIAILTTTIIVLLWRTPITPPTLWSDPTLCEKKNSFLPMEVTYFMQELIALTEKDFHLFGKTSLDQLFTPLRNISPEHIPYVEQELKALFVDLILCDKTDFTPLCAIRLVDAPPDHPELNADQKREQQLIKDIAQHTRFPIQFFETNQTYSVEEIQEALKKILPSFSIEPSSTEPSSTKKQTLPSPLDQIEQHKPTESLSHAKKTAEKKKPEEVVLQLDDIFDLSKIPIKKRPPTKKKPAEKAPLPAREKPTEPLKKVSQKEAHPVRESSASPKVVTAKTKRSPQKSARQKKRFCPKCEHPMQLKKARSGRFKGRLFLTCSNKPECRTIIPLKPIKNAS
ncbi:topoisomerase DNA-binding C4 zinc finger domain-containing protein [Magnetococcales bacterium HHB-1]